ncbi:MAG TPA: hypothetical protein PLU43_01650 [Lachnospiraceae bacterium]|nr:hypothetical protein [Lachnospiraceae bacterium]
MSVYTEAEHAIALADTKFWIEHPPVLTKDRYAYGQYHFRLKDYSEAVHWFLIAAESGCEEAWFDIGVCIYYDLLNDSDIPRQYGQYGSCFSKAFAYYENCASMPSCSSLEKYRLAILYRYRLGTNTDLKKAFQLFQDVTDMHADLTEAHFHAECNYSYEGSDISAGFDVCKLPAGSSYYELAKYYAEGISPVGQDISHARILLKKAHDFHSEEALFYDFTRFGNNFDNYEYQDDIKELYSFLIGLYIRVSEVHPSVKAYERLIRLYENGYPGDTDERAVSFFQKAERFRKKLHALQDS